MRGAIVHSVYGVHEGRETDTHFGTYRTLAEAEASIERLLDRRERDWQEQYHNRGFVIRQVVVENDFQIPPLPKPRDKYVAQGTAKPNRPGTWDSTIVQISRRVPGSAQLEPVCAFERNYSLLRTFEPFRQGEREFALISRSYTQTAVLDLASGKVIAEEVDQTGAGLCPVGFYVPDWWDLHDGTMIPGNPHWSGDDEWPCGTFGFVWGCVWGDDSSWKVQYLDLSAIHEGKIIRDDRFGYVPLATTDYDPPSLNPEPLNSAEPSTPPPFISIARFGGKTNVTFAVEMDFDLETGTSRGWHRPEGFDPWE
jgi:hypothetical protein